MICFGGVLNIFLMSIFDENIIDTLQ